MTEFVDIARRIPFDMPMLPFFFAAMGLTRPSVGLNPHRRRRLQVFRAIPDAP
jgi:hypothetical protein